MRVVRPMDDLGLFLAQMRTLPRYPSTREWLETNDNFRRNVLELLGRSGPLLSRDIPDFLAFVYLRLRCYTFYFPC